MRTKLIRIGKSKGIRISKAVIKQCRFGDKVELDMLEGLLVIRPVRSARLGWDQAFAKMRQRGDDELVDRELAAPTEWDRKAWTW